MPAERDQDAAVRERLPHVWHAFFGRFGRLTEVQRLAAGPLAEGEAVLLAAPTASGKTEAAVAPLLERVLAARERPAGLALLVVTPTRALANDLHRRLEGPLRRAGVTLDRKTGDSPGFDDAAPPTVLVTTPESLDSLLSRRPRALASVSAVLVDELHLLHRSARGDQLGCLLTRLDRVTTAAVQRCAASATVADPGALARRFLGADARVVLAGAARPRTIDATLAPAATLDEAAEAIRALFTGGEAAKILVFANARGQVEALAATLARDGRLASRVFAHHGSLAREERLRVERRFLDAPRAVCVATMTLELGIDIGDVDRAVLVAPPPDVSSLVQRVGRANRTGDVTRVLCLHDGDFERVRFEHLLACAAAGRLFDEPVAFRPTVVAQQALSLLLQSPGGWVSAAAVHGRLAPDGAALWGADDCERILRGLAERGWLRAVDRGRYVAEEEAQRAFRLGRMHTVIVSAPEVEVVDEATGRAIGHARVTPGERERLEDGAGLSLALGGKRREVTRLREDRVFVRSGEGVDESRFIAREAPRYSLDLAQDLARHVGMPEGTLVCEPRPDGGWRLAHFLGTVGGALLDGVLRQRKAKGKGRGDAFFTRVDAPPEVAAGAGLGERAALARALRADLAGRRKTFARLLEPGPYLDAVPEDLVTRWLEASVDVERLADRLASVEVAVAA